MSELLSSPATRLPEGLTPPTLLVELDRPEIIAIPSPDYARTTFDRAFENWQAIFRQLGVVPGTTIYGVDFPSLRWPHADGDTIERYDTAAYQEIKDLLKDFDPD